jgi:YARHG domain
MRQLQRASVLAALVAGIVQTVPSVAFAQSSPRFMTCEEMWFVRNDIYKEKGYCFRTQRAISTFGNAGCRYDDINDVPLSANERNKIAEVTRWERIKGCPR